MQIKNIHNIQKQRGYSLVEMLVYVSLLSLISLMVVESVLTMTRIFPEFMIARDLDHSGRASMGRIIHELRVANNVDTDASTFNNPNGKLQLESIDELGANRIVEIYLDGGRIKLEEDDVDMGYLTSKNVTVNEMVFYHLPNTESQGVRMILNLTAEKGNAQKTIVFNTTTVLRGSY